MLTCDRLGKAIIGVRALADLRAILALPATPKVPG